MTTRIRSSDFALRGLRHVAPALALLAVTSLAAPLVPAACAQEGAGALLDAALAAYGGWDRLASVTGYRLEGTVLRSHATPPSPTSRLFARPCRLRVALEYPDRTETRIVDGEQGWRSGSGGAIAPASGPLLDSMRLQCARAALPWILAERRDSATLIEPVAVPGASLSGVEVVLGEGLTLRAFVDPASGRVLRALTVLSNPAMQIAFETRYSDFREVDGVLFAHREENYAGGNHTASTTIESVELNPELSDASFLP